MNRVALAALLLVATTIGDPLQGADPATECGTRYAPPFAEEVDHAHRRCEQAVRRYRSKYSGVGHQMLDQESQACFVPDDSYGLLDRIVEAAKIRIRYDPALHSVDAEEQARRVSSQIGDLLKEFKFGLYIPTETLADALTPRASETATVRFMVDCDTSSLIYLTIADVLGLPMSLVEITLPSGSGHNYVRWKLDDYTILDWDTNGRMVCVTPKQTNAHQGQSMTRSETLAYGRVLRATAWEHQKKFREAITDYRTALRDYAWSAVPWNNLAWVIATKVVSVDRALIQEGRDAAERAVALARTANNLDTLACMVARQGDFARAQSLETEALRLSATRAFEERLRWFQQGKDCVGAE